MVGAEAGVQAGGEAGRGVKPEVTGAGMRGERG